MLQVCSNCLQSRNISDFQEPTRTYKTCEKCRSSRKRKQYAIDDTLPTEESLTVTPVPLEKLRPNFTTATEHFTEGYNYEAIISLNDTILALTDTEIAKLLCSKLGECDKYKYILKTVNPSTARKGVASFYANCSQSMALAKSKSIATYTRPQRQYKQRQRFNCKGRVSASIDRVAQQAHVMVEHELRHDPPEPSRKTPNEVRELIKREAIVLGRSAKDIHTNIQQQFPDTNITAAQVYYWWREFKQDAQPSTKKQKVKKENALGE